MLGLLLWAQDFPDDKEIKLLRRGKMTCLKKG